MERKEFLRRLDLEEGQLTEAGAVDVEEDMKDVIVAEGTIDSPTNDFCSATMFGKSIPEVIMAMGFQASISNWGVIEGEPRAEEDAEAPDSDEAERTGGWSWNEFRVECGDPEGLW